MKSLYKDGLFKAIFTILESDIDMTKHWAPTTKDKKITIADYTTVYSMKEWFYTPHVSAEYFWCFLRYYTGTFYLEVLIDCNNPRNEKKLTKAMDAFIEHMNSHLS